MNNSNEYPQSIAELNIDGVELKPEVIAAVKRFAKSRPWRGSLAERQAKFQNSIKEICHAAGVESPVVLFRISESINSGRSCFIFATQTIVLRGRLSVVTMLHEVAHLLFGASEHVACEWSLRLFSGLFPAILVEADFQRAHGLKQIKSSSLYSRADENMTGLLCFGVDKELRCARARGEVRFQIMIFNGKERGL